MRGHHRGGGPSGRGSFGRGRFGGGPFGRPGMEERMGRLLGHGDLRYVILGLLEEKPRHGYEIIKALEEMSSGIYSPSPGSIYPTLTFLEEGGFATATTESNKKLYTITPEGKVLLDENRDFLKQIRERFAHAGDRMARMRHWFGRDEAEAVGRDERSSIRGAMHRLKAELFAYLDAKAASKTTKSAEQKFEKKVADIIERAADEIRNLKSETNGKSES